MAKAKLTGGKGADGSDSRCACDSGGSFLACCGPFLAGEAIAPTAVALMRSRYTAFTRNNQVYLQASWHPRTRPAAGSDEASQAPCQWLGLQVLSYQQDGDQGTVEFIARYKTGGRAGRLHEVSRFVCEAGQWLYLDGTFLE
jgi:SEC-C motif-containing protein